MRKSALLKLPGLAPIEAVRRRGCLVACVAWLAGCAVFGGSNDGTSVSAQGAALAFAPPEQDFVTTEHPSAVGPLIVQVNDPAASLDKIVVTPNDQLAQAKLAFEVGPGSHMIDYEGKVHDIAAIAKLVEYATPPTSDAPGLKLYDDVYRTIHADLFDRIEKLKAGDPKAFGDFPVTKDDWTPDYTKTPGGFVLGWSYTQFRNGRYTAPSDAKRRREIYVRLPDVNATGGILREDVIKEIARVNYRYIAYLQEHPELASEGDAHRLPGDASVIDKEDCAATADGGDALVPLGRNAVVRLIDPQSKTEELVQSINLDYDRILRDVVAAYENAYAANPALRPSVMPRIVRTVATPEPDGSQTRKPIFPIQATALLEDPESIVRGALWVKNYIKFYATRYQRADGTLVDPPSALLFIAGSDLNRITGSVTGELLRSVMINRLAVLQSERPNTHVVPWIGRGSGDARSGGGTLMNRNGVRWYNEQEGPGGKHALLNVGIASTFQPDHLEAGSTPTTKQPSFDQIKMVYEVAKTMTSGAPMPAHFDDAEEQRRLIWSGVMMFTHIDRINRYAVPLSNLRTLLELHNQVGRVKSGKKAQPAPQPGAPPAAGELSRDWPDVNGYIEQVLNNEEYGFNPGKFGNGSAGKLRDAVRSLLTTLRSRLAEAPWTGDTRSTRAINDAFGRLIWGAPLTTVHGIGATLRLLDKVEDLNEVKPDGDAQNGNGSAITPQIKIIREALGIAAPQNGDKNDRYGILFGSIPEEIQALWRFYVRNDGFTIIRSGEDHATNGDDQVIEDRIRVAFPDNAQTQSTIERLKLAQKLNVMDYGSFIAYLKTEYINDVDALEYFIAHAFPKAPDGGDCHIYIEACSGVSQSEAKAYRDGIRALVGNSAQQVPPQPDFAEVMNPPAANQPKPKVLTDESTWKALFKNFIIPILTLPSWNRIG